VTRSLEIRPCVRGINPSRISRPSRMRESRDEFVPFPGEGRDGASGRGDRRRGKRTPLDSRLAAESSYRGNFNFLNASMVTQKQLEPSDTASVATALAGGLRCPASSNFLPLARYLYRCTVSTCRRPVRLLARQHPRIASLSPARPPFPPSRSVVACDPTWMYTSTVNCTTAIMRDRLQTTRVSSLARSRYRDKGCRKVPGFLSLSTVRRARVRGANPRFRPAISLTRDRSATTSGCGQIDEQKVSGTPLRAP